MRVDGLKTIGRLAAGAVLLTLLLLVGVRPSSAHGAMHHAAPQAAVEQSGFHLDRPGTPRPAQPCGECPPCCAIGQCVAASVVLPGIPSTAVPMTRVPAAYARYASAEAAGRSNLPATPPPRLDA